MKTISLPIKKEELKNIKIGDQLLINGLVFCGRDAALPKVLKMIDDGNDASIRQIKGCAIFHTAVSCAGIGPTSSNKLEIEASIVPLSEYGVALHIGKGKISNATIEGLSNFNSIYCVVPPITALLGSKIQKKELVLFPELGMEAFYKIEVKDFPAIVAVAHGESIYEK